MIWTSQRGQLPSETGKRTAVAGRDWSEAMDGTIVLYAAEGDGSAMAELVSRYRSIAFGVARRLVRDSQDAEDVCQEALITVVQRIGECRHPERFRAWLLKIVRNQAITFLRRRAVRNHLPLEFAGEVPGRDDPAREMERLDLRHQIGFALEGLTSLQKEVVVLYDLEGWRHSEIANRLGITQGSARVHLHNARRALRVHLSRDAPDNLRLAPACP